MYLSLPLQEKKVQRQHEYSGGKLEEKVVVEEEEF